MYFKDTNNNLHFIDDASFTHLLPSDCVEITDEEYAILSAPTPEQIAAQALAQSQAEADHIAKQVAKADAVVQYLVNHTPAECASYVQANVTNLSEAKGMLAKFAMALCVLAKGNLRD